MDSFSFDERFQQHYLSFLLSDPTFLQHVRPDIKPELFTSDVAQSVCRLALAFSDEHGSPPGDLLLTEIDRLSTKAAFKPGQLDTLKAYTKKLLDLPLQNRTYILREHDVFMRHQRLLKMFPKFSEAMKKGDHDRAESLLNDVVTFRPSYQQQPGHKFTADAAARIQRRGREDQERFWLLIPELDQVVNGLRRKQVGVWQSQRSSAGKTCALIHCIKAFIFQGWNVLAITVEDGREVFEDKIDMAVAGLTNRDLSNQYEIEKSMRRWFRHGGNLHIGEFSPINTKVSTLRAYKKYLESTENFYADVVILDYADLLGPETASLQGDLFASGMEVYGHLSSWAKEENIAIWTAMQSGRAAGTSTHADMEHSGMSIAKAWIAWQILSINRTAEEQQEGLTNVYVVKNKDGPARFGMTFRSDFDRQHFYCMSTGE